MRRVLELSSALVVVLLIAIPLAWASAIDKHIEELKSSDPEVRAKAAYELGCT
ncbi:MAG: hypothetical protein HY914_20840 [Desulfomonile tiedjei]|nr:hypothetical protein [Desulfomonile tiedjei]